MLPEKKSKDLKRFLEFQRGFTLIEIIMVVAVMGIMVSIAVPNFSRWSEKHQINGQAQKVYFDLMLARTNAVKTNSTITVTFDTTAHTYTIKDADDATLKTVTLEHDVRFAFNTGWKDTDINPVTTAVGFGAANAQTVVFDARGQADNSGSVFLLHGNDVGVSSDRARCVTVLQATGGVDYWSYDGTVASGQPTWK